MKRFLPLVLLAAVWVPNPVLANRAPPPPVPEKPKHTLVIEIDDNAKQARLLIPRSMVAEEKAPKKTGWLTVPTVVVAICLSAAFVTGGMWFVRRGKGGLNKTTLAVLLALTVLAAGSASVWADLGFPKDRATPPRPVPVQGLGNFPVEVEIVEKGDNVRLIVNKQMHKQMQPPVAPPAPKSSEN